MVLRLTDAQNATILAIAETIVGPLPDDVAKDIVSEHMDTVRNLSEGTDEAAGTPTEDELLATTQVHPRELGLLASVEVMLHKLPKDRWSEFEKVLYLLSTGWGTKVVTASARMVPFHELTVGEREDALRNLTLSSFAKVRSLFQVFKALVSFCMFAKTRSVHGKLNPLWENLHYPGRPEEKKRPPRSQFWEPTFEDMTAMAKVAGKGNPITLETDVVVIGSGAGGGVVAAELAQAGHRVLVLEKAVYFHPADASFNELQGFWDHYESAALLTSEDLSMMLLAGSAWGGGTFINWCLFPSNKLFAIYTRLYRTYRSASLPPPHELCHEWATTYNLPYFKSQAFQDAISTVCTRAGVSAEAVLHNVPNQVLLDGAIKLGYPVEAVPQNTNGHVHECGFCTLGCPYGEKQGSHVTWLRDAADAGAKFVDGCYVDKVTYVKDAASGVEATVLNGSVRLVVKAKTVVCCAGSLHTPALLLRSGLRNPNIGRHLRLHPVATVHGFFPHKQVQSWSGSILTTVCNVVRNIHGHGYGARLEIPASLMGLTASLLPWRSNADMHRLMLQYPQLVNMIVLARDLDSVSSVVIDADGRPRIHFQLGSKDGQSLVEGLVAGIKVLLAQGAVEVNTTQFHLPPLRLQSKEDLANPVECATTQRWIAQVRALGAVQNSIGIMNAHQMGSCRMGSTPEMGAVNPDGETWDVRGLYVADASLFPTASGVK
ncbi:hypothetical protein, variant 2 [Aphanomyces astaci]|uniref:Long-chain-alcohol oxidase n=1 Tax=Aphanomyces astaci TaxID=112090 RepID=W4GJ79_APHAT|nr:hypothetical protein, variant 2 [Aphanomyces astaci]ETV79386.1 hypothetical protein, variant 2 [Aphanomyces astaci]|eukprot:XP_009831230.1 hypothetical protein, variant 2 [Aphanomyces astaci]